MYLKIGKYSFLLNRQKLPFFLYTLVGLALFIALLSSFNTYVLHMKVEMAVVASPLEAITAPLSGFVSQVWVAPGATVKKGQPLVRIESVELTKDLQMAQLNAEDAKLSILYYESMLKNEKERLQIYENVGSTRLTSANADVRIANEEYLAAKKNLARMQALHKKHYLSEADWDLVIAKYRTTEDKLKRSIALKELESHSLNSVEKGLYFTGNKLEGRERDIYAELDSAKSKLKIYQERVRVFAELTNKLILTAPYDGKVLQILRSAGNTADSMKPLLVLEKANVNKTITAYLTQSEILHLRLNSRARIYIPALGNTYLGKVVEVNRTAGFIDEIKAQYRSRNIDIDRTAIAVVAIDNIDQHRFDREVAAGMPAIVYFSRRLTLF